jgi:TRAP transporter 4TM/12TM fusion protein
MHEKKLRNSDTTEKDTFKEIEDITDLQGITAEQAAQLDDDELESIASKKKKKTKRRKFEGQLKTIITILTVCMSAYHLYTSIFVINPLQHRAIHLLFVMVLVFILYPATPKSPTHRPSVVDWGLVALTIAVFANLLIRFPALARAGGRGNTTDLICGVIIVLLVLELARRVVGLILPCMALFMIGYGFLGYLVPGPLHHAGFKWNRIVQHLTLTTEGVFGQILSVSASFIYLFILFGAFLSVTGMAGVFNDMALSIAGSRRGGPAKVSVLASGLMGSVSGSASANVVTTGSFTIPLMRKMGYRDYFASAVEAAASTGGQIMPPVMGAAAFLIADSLGIPFLTVIRAAFLPAVLYYYSIWHMVDLRARKENIQGLSKDELPNLKELLIKRGHLLIPLVGIIYMLVSGYNAITAAVMGIVLSIVSSFLKRDTWIKPIELINAMQAGALSALPVATACAVIGILVGIISLTGAILAASAAVLKMSGGILFVTLIMTMLTATMLGMGMPTTACYIITSTVAAPSIIQLGVPALAAHLFVFYYGILSAITPPVASAAYTAAGLSGAGPNKVGFAAVRLAIAGWIVPFMFVYSSELLMPEGLNFLILIRVAITSVIGIAGLGWCMEGYCRRKLNVIERLICIVGAILLIDSGFVTDIVGLACVGGIYLMQRNYERKHPAEVKPV